MNLGASKIPEQQASNDLISSTNVVRKCNHYFDEIATTNIEWLNFLIDSSNNKAYNIYVSFKFNLQLNKQIKVNGILKSI